MFVVISKAEKKLYTGLYEILEKVRNNFEELQQNSAERTQLRVFMTSEKCVFNIILSMDLMRLDLKTVLHMVERDGKFRTS